LPSSQILASLILCLIEFFTNPKFNYTREVDWDALSYLHDTIMLLIEREHYSTVEIGYNVVRKTEYFVSL
jgi:hypothetical protein